MTKSNQGGAAEARRWDFLAAVVEHPVRALAILCSVQIVFWTALPALVDTAPPNDVVEGFMWGREWVVMTYKHPQLPPWLLEISHLLTGSFRWPEFLLAQISVCLTFLVVYLLARDFLGGRRALASILLMPSIYFFEWPTQQYNHDFAQMPFWAAIAWTLWRAVEGNERRWWILLGLASGLGMHAKFSTGVLLAFGGIWLLVDRRGRQRLATPWPWVGFALFLLILTPIIVGVFRYDFMPLTFVMHRADWALKRHVRLYYIGVQVAAFAGFFVVLAASGLLRRGAGPEPVAPAPPLDRRALGYLLWMGLGPAGLLMIASLFEGLGEAWGTTMYNLVGVVAVAFLGDRLTPRAMQRLAVAALVFIVGTSSIYAAAKWTRCNLFGELLKVCWPAEAISDRMEDIWHQRVNAPLRIVGGSDRPARIAGLDAPDEPSIFTGLDFRDAPWITPERIRRQGMLLVWDGMDPPARLKPWIGNRPTGSASFDWSDAAPPLVLHYAVIPPGAADLPPASNPAARDAPE